MQYFLLACDLLLRSFHEGQGFFLWRGYFSLNWLKCVSASLWNDSSLVCRDATKPRRPNAWTTGAARRVFRLVSLPWFLLFIRPNIDFNSRGGGGGGGSATFEGWMVCGLQSLISFIYIYIFFYRLQGETLYYNTAQHAPPEWWIVGDLPFGDNQAKSQTHLSIFLVQSRYLCTLAPTQHVQIKILTLNRCLPVIIRSVAE